MQPRSARSTPQRDNANIPSAGYVRAVGDGALLRAAASTVAKGARFCARCGVRLAQSCCPACGCAVQADHQFCAACGPSARCPAPNSGRRRAAAGDRAVRRSRRLHRARPASSDAEEVHDLLDRFFAPSPTAWSRSPAARSTSTSATASWRCSARRWRTATTPSGPCAPRSPSATPCRRSAASSAASWRCTSASPAARSWRAGPAARPPRLHRHRRLGEPRLAPHRPAAARRDPDLGRGAPPAAERLRVQPRPARSRSRASPSRSAPGGCSACARPAELAGRPFVGRRSRARPVRRRCSQACRDSGAGRRSTCAARPASARPAWSRSSSAGGRGAGFACHAGLVLDFGAGTGQDAIRALVRSLLGLRRRAAPTAARGGAPSGPGRRRPGRRGAPGLPQRPARPAAADRAARALRRHGQRDAQPRQARDAWPRWCERERARGRCCWWSRTCTGPTSRPSRTWRAWPQTVAACPAPPGHDLADRGRPARPGLARAARRQPAADHRSRPAAAEEASALAAAYLEADARVRPSAASSGRRATRCSSSSCCATPRRAPRPACRARCRAWCRRASTGSSPRTSRPCRRPPCSASASRWTRCATCSSAPTTTARALVEQLLVRPQGEGFLFAHALIRDAVYDTLLKARRRELHRRGGGLVRRARPGAARRAPRPGRGSRRRRAPISRRRAQQARGLPLRAGAGSGRARPGARRASAADRFALTCLQGELLARSRRHGGSRARPTRRRSPPPATTRERCRAWLGLAAVKRVTDDLDGAFADLERAEAVADAAWPRPRSSRASISCAATSTSRAAGIEGCLAEHQQSLELARAAGSAELEAQALGGLGDAEYVRGRMLTAGRHFRALRRALPPARLRPHRGRQPADGGVHPRSTPATYEGALEEAPQRGRGGGAGRSPARRDDRVATASYSVPGSNAATWRAARRARRTRDSRSPASSAPGASRPRGWLFLAARRRRAPAARRRRST